MIKACEFKVTGRVQGVGFRYFTQNLARSLGLRGAVWNAEDGSVEGIVVGDKVSQFLKGLKDGPGRVDSVMRTDTIHREYASFEIETTR